MFLILWYGLPLGDSEELRANSGAANAVVRRGDIQYDRVVLYIWNIHPPLGTRPRPHDPHVTVLSPFRFKEIPPLRYRLLNFKQRVIDRERHGGGIAKLDLGRRLAALVTREFHRLEAQGRYQQDGCL